jgi:hypothetical protein
LKRVKETLADSLDTFAVQSATISPVLLSLGLLPTQVQTGESNPSNQQESANRNMEGAKQILIGQRARRIY